MKRKVYFLFLIVLVSGCIFDNPNENGDIKKDKNEEVKKDSENDSEDTKDLNNDKENEVTIDAEKENKYIINLEQSVQENGYYCVPACVQMILKLHGIEMSQTQLAKEMNTSSITGTEYVDLARVINKYRFNNEHPRDGEAGYRVCTLDVGVWNDETFRLLEERIKANIASNDPVLIAINLQTLYPELPNANHQVLLTGYTLDENGNIMSYYIVDPYYEVQDETYKGLKIFDKNIIYQALTDNVEPAYIW